jgi:hypothetical protein
MKRYETFLDKHCGQPFANIEEDANGGLVMYDEAQAEIDRLRAENAELKIRFSELLQQDFRGHQLQDRMMFTVKGREIIEWWAALDKSAIAKARDEP